MNEKEAYYGRIYERQLARELDDILEEREREEEELEDVEHD